MHPLITRYLDGTLSLTLKDLKLKNPGQTLLTDGTGELAFSDGELKATVTGKADEPTKFTVGEGQNAGFEAAVYEDEMTVSAIFNGSSRFYDQVSEQQVWTGALQRIRLEKRITEYPTTSRFVGVLVSFPQLTFGMSRNKQKKSWHFGDAEDYHQYLEFDVENYSVAMRRRGKYAEVAALVQPSTSVEDVRLLQEALKNAISIRWGFDVAWLAVSVSTYDSDSVSFFPWTEILRTSHLGSTPPLAVGPFADGTNERLLKLGLKYFLQSDRVPLEEYLNLFWHSAGSLSIPVREACLGAAIEGIAQEVIERGSNNIVLEIKEAKQRFRACKQKLLAHIKKAGEEVLQDSSFGVLHGAIKQAEFFRAKEVLAKAATAVGFTLSSSELKGWGDMRNDAAHDKSPVKEHDEKRYRDYYACIGILNKFALALIGYEGIIDDYSDLQRKTVNFKLWK